MNTARASGFKTIPSTRLQRPASKATINVAFLPVVADAGGRQSLPLLCFAFSESNPPTIDGILVKQRGRETGLSRRGYPVTTGPSRYAEGSAA